MTGHQRSWSGVIVLLVLLAAGVPLAPASAATSEVAREILAQPRYQTSLPGAADGLPGFGDSGNTHKKAGDAQGDAGKDSAGQDRSTSGDRMGNGGDASGSDMPGAPVDSSAQSDVTASALTRSILALIPILAVIGLLLLLAYLGYKFWRNRRRASTPEPASAAPTNRPVLEPMSPTPVTEQLPEWQVLANQGRFTEAIHLLLLQLLRDMRGEGLVTLTQSLTSREILRASDLPTERRSGLATVIGAVEFCHFGGRAAGLVLYEKCLAAYHLATNRTPSHVATE
jgi:hypothetical protein